MSRSTPCDCSRFPRMHDGAGVCVNHEQHGHKPCDAYHTVTMPPVTGYLDVKGGYSPRKLAASAINELAKLSDMGLVDWSSDVPRNMYNDVVRATISYRAGRFEDAYAQAKPALDILRGIVARKARS